MNKILSKTNIILLMLFILFQYAECFGKPLYSSIVVDYETNKILYAKNPNEYRYPASLTKVMTLYLVFKALDNGTLKLNQQLPISRYAARKEPSRLGLSTQETITVKNSIYALVTKSANDVATVLAEAIAGSEREFSRLMTRQARALGMTRTSFYNSSGLPNTRQRTTAKDMAILGVAILRDFPHHYHYFNTIKFSYNGRIYKTHNRLLMRYPGVDGLKTGYIRASGYNVLTSATHHGHRVVAVVMGGKTARSRDRHMMQLLNKTLRKPKRFRQFNHVGI